MHMQPENYEGLIVYLSARRHRWPEPPQDGSPQDPKAAAHLSRRQQGMGHKNLNLLPRCRAKEQHQSTNLRVVQPRTASERLT